MDWLDWSYNDLWGLIFIVCDHTEKQINENEGLAFFRQEKNTRRVIDAEHEAALVKENYKGSHERVWWCIQRDRAEGRVLVDEIQ